MKPVAYLKLVRPKQWLKNVFIGVPLFFGGKLTDPTALTITATVFVLFCLVSSAVYVLNDWRDRAADAVHPMKRNRPIASGEISSVSALIFLVLLLLAAIGLFLWARPPVSVASVLLIYVAINVLYSFGLKHVSLLELFLVASGFVLRVLAGGAALVLPLSSWLLAMTGVVAMLIVTAKRRGEIAEGHDPNSNRRSLTGYNLNFLDSMISMLTGMTLVFYLLFTTSEYAASRFGNNALMITTPIVAYGVMRYVQITKVSSGADDPTELVMSDPGIGLSVLLFGIVFAFILYA